MTRDDKREEMRQQVAVKVGSVYDSSCARNAAEAADAVYWPEIEHARRDAREVRRLDDTWTVAVEVPISLPVEMRHDLFAAITRAVSEWEPDDRDGWDVDVSGYPTAHALAANDETVTLDRDTLVDILARCRIETVVPEDGEVKISAESFADAIMTAAKEEKNLPSSPGGAS